MPRTVHDKVGAEAADDVADPFDALLRRPDLVDVHGGLSAELACELKARRLGRTDADDAASAHLLRGCQRQDADRSRALDDDIVAPLEAACPAGTVERADASGQRFAE